MRSHATTLMLAGLVAAYVLGGLPLPAGVVLGVAMLSIAVPVALREAGRLRDQDELQLAGQRRGALWAFVLLLVMAPFYPHLEGGVREEFAGRSVEAAIALFALVYLAVARGAGDAVRLLAGISALLAVAYGLSRAPDWDKLAAMTAVAVALLAVGWLAGRTPRLAAVVVGVVWIVRLVGAARGGLPEAWVYLPSAVFVGVAVALLARVPAAGAPDATA